MSADPLDKQLVEAVLSRPRRAKADLEEAKLAGLRPSRPKAGVAVVRDDEDEDDEDEDDEDEEFRDSVENALADRSGPAKKCNHVN